MMRRFRHLSVTLLAAFGVAATATSAASATEFTSASSPVAFHAVQSEAEPLVLRFDGYEVVCQVATFSGEVSTPTTSVTITPKYSEVCNSGFGYKVTMNGCDYLLHLPAIGNSATVDLVCPAGKDVTLEIGGGVCTVHIPPFTGKGSVTLTNNGNHISAKPAISGITMSLTDDGGIFCIYPPGGTHVTNGTLSGGAMTIIGNSAISVD
ncbi:MAG TPA: hypothetical protein VGV69_10750 [Solirubrobacterales bacterium]|nr:hypothetical protein [Solirubrobacterales bacterium]